ncbi:unnamed protein product [Amoebophrya sp. A25]|nr:unnamed protein product [Amoebophrya sp. A25]|eukprot:GSA25T00024955001.1
MKVSEKVTQLLSYPKHVVLHVVLVLLKKTKTPYYLRNCSPTEDKNPCITVEKKPISQSIDQSINQSGDETIDGFMDLVVECCASKVEFLFAVVDHDEWDGSDTHVLVEDDVHHVPPPRRGRLEVFAATRFRLFGQRH